MINYNNNDLEIYPLYKAISEKIGAEEVTDKDVWNEARGYLDVPNFEKILLELTRDSILQRLAELFESWGQDLDDVNIHFEIDGRASYININSDEVENVNDFVIAINVNGGML